MQLFTRNTNKTNVQYIYVLYMRSYVYSTVRYCIFRSLYIILPYVHIYLSMHRIVFFITITIITVITILLPVLLLFRACCFVCVSYLCACVCLYVCVCMRVCVTYMCYNFIKNNNNNNNWNHKWKDSTKQPFLRNQTDKHTIISSADVIITNFLKSSLSS